MEWVGDHMSMPRGRGVDVLGSWVGAGKEKDRAMPASDAVVMKGMVKMSWPSEMASMRLWGVDIGARDRRGRWWRVGDMASIEAMS